MNLPPLTFAQLNPIVGDIAGNAEKIMAAYRQAGPGALVVCPELSLTGYPPEDLLLLPQFRKEAMAAARSIAAATGEAGLVFGTVWEEGGAVYNAAVLAAQGGIRHIHYKIMLPNYGVFDEKRTFMPGHEAKVVELNGRRMALLVCEDIWHAQFARSLADQHPDFAVVINASPFERGKIAVRRRVVATAAQALGAPVAYVNMTGGQDDLVFDGGSFMCDAKGYITAQAPQFAEGLFGADKTVALMEDEESVWRAMQLGLADYVRKNGFKGVLLGLSGGIDSAISAALAVDALGSANVRGVLLPSPFTSPESNEDALELAQNLGIRTDTIPITPAMETMEAMLSPLMQNVRENLAVGGNLQARIRGQVLMAISNQTGLMLLSTGNKSEIAVGYTTLYGDSCGGYNVLKDVYKTEVYALAKWRNAQSAVIPARSISKAPSAELKPGQKDSDQLPDYVLLDEILALHLEGQLSASEISAKGFDAALVNRIVEMVKRSEYKRRQSAPGVKISAMMFGRDRRFPLTNGFGN